LFQFSHFLNAENLIVGSITGHGNECTCVFVFHHIVLSFKQAQIHKT